MKWPLLLLLACLPAWAYPPIFQADVPDPEAVTCLYENATAGQVEQFPVATSTERGKPEYDYRVCLRSALDWPTGPNSIRLAVRTADGRTSAYAEKVIPRPAGSVTSARLSRDASPPPPPTDPPTHMASDPFAGSGTLTSPWIDYSPSSFWKLSQSGGNVAPNGPNESTGFYYSGAATGNNQFSEITIVGSLGSAQTYWTASVRVTGASGTRALYQITVTSNAYYLTKVVAGSGTDVVSGSGTFNGSSTPVVIRLEAEDSGANVLLRAYKDGVQFASYTDTSSVLTGGQPGLEVYAASGVLTPVTLWSGGDLAGGGSTVTSTTSLSAAVQAGRAATASMSAAVQAGRSASSELSASVQVGRSATASVSTAVQRLASASASLDAAVQAARAATTSASAAVQAGGLRTASVDAVVQRVEQVALSLSAAVQAVNVAALSVNGYVQSESAASVSLGAAVLHSRDASLGLSAGVQLAQQASTALGAAVLELRAATVSINAQVQAGTTATSDLSVAVEDLRSASAAVSVAVQSVQSASSELSVAVSVAQTLSTALSAVAQTSGECSTSLSAYVSVPSSGDCPSADEIATAVLAMLNATRIPVNVKQMNDADVIGDGSEADMWRGVGVPP